MVIAATRYGRCAQYQLVSAAANDSRAGCASYMLLCHASGLLLPCCCCHDAAMLYTIYNVEVCILFTLLMYATDSREGWASYMLSWCKQYIKLMCLYCRHFYMPMTPEEDAPHMLLLLLPCYYCFRLLPIVICTIYTLYNEEVCIIYIAHSSEVLHVYH